MNKVYMMKFGVKTKHQKLVLVVALSAIFFIAFTTLGIVMLMRDQSEQLSAYVADAFFKNTNSMGLGSMKSQGRAVGLRRGYELPEFVDCTLCDVNTDSVVSVTDIRSMAYCVAAEKCKDYDLNGDGDVDAKDGVLSATSIPGVNKNITTRMIKACTGLKVAGLKDELGASISCTADVNGDGALTNVDVAACALQCFYNSDTSVTPAPTVLPTTNATPPVSIIPSPDLTIEPSLYPTESEPSEIPPVRRTTPPLQ